MGNITSLEIGSLLEAIAFNKAISGGAPFVRPKSISRIPS
jgi:hypothetical protein